MLICCATPIQSQTLCAVTEHRCHRKLRCLSSPDTQGLIAQQQRVSVAASGFAVMASGYTELVPVAYCLCYDVTLSDATPSRTLVSVLLRCFQDKVNISVAIIPMAKAFGWSPTVAGLVQSSFFWGYIVSQIPGGYVNSRFGGRTVLPLGVGLWSGATAAVPVLAGTIPGAQLCSQGACT